MARIKFTAIVESIRGTIGGTTFQRNAYGYTVKAKPNMLNPYTDFQQTQKAYMTRAAQEWRNLTDAQRADWNTFAENNPRPSRLNPNSYLSGYNLFLLVHRYRFIAGDSVLTSPSLVLETLGTVENILYYDVGALKWETNPTGTTGNWKAILFLTNVIPYGREFINYTPRVIYFGAYNPAAVYDITSSYQAKISSLPPVGQWVGMKQVIYCTTTGQVTITPTIQIQVNAI